MALAFGPSQGFSRVFSGYWWAVVGTACCITVSGWAAVPVISDTLVVIGERGGGVAAPQTFSLVTRLDLTEPDPGRDLGQLLAGIAGFQVARTGAWGATAVPSLRGSSPAQIQFFLDGIPLPDAQTGLAAFQQVPLDRLQAVEVHRGVVPVGLGGIGGAGAVNLITKQQDDAAAVVVEAGSFGAWGGRVSVAQTSDDATKNWLVMVHGHRADNDFSYRDHNQTFHRTDDDTMRVRRNAWLREAGAWGQGKWRGLGAELRARAGYRQRDGGRPGPLGYASPHASVSQENWDGALHAVWGDGGVAADLAGGRSREVLSDPFGEVGYAPAGTTRATSKDLYARLAWSPNVMPALLGLDLGVTWRGQWQVESRAGITDPQRGRRQASVFGALTLNLVGGRFRVVPAGRWQVTRDNFPGVSIFPWLPEPEGVVNERHDVSPSLGLVWEIASGTVFAEAHFARTVRVPTWIELFGHRGGVDGNRALLPESISTGDLALSVRHGRRWTGRAALFQADTDDKIIFIQNSQRTSRAINLGRTAARGVEGELAFEVAQGWSVRGNLTWQRVTDRGSDPAYVGKSVPFLPDVETGVRLAGKLGRWQPWLATEYMGANHRDRANTALDRAPARTLWHVGISRAWSVGGLVSLSGEVINLTNNIVYDVEGFPLPGRSWNLSVKIGS